LAKREGEKAVPENITVVGNISRDTAWYGTNKRASFFGGAGLNIAWSLAHHGQRPRLISVLGQADRFLLNELSQFVDTTYVHIFPGETCQFTFYYTNDGRLEHLVSSFGVALSLDAHIQRVPLTFGHHHICCRHPIHPEPLLRQLIQNQIPFSLDFILSSIAMQLESCKESITFATCVFVNGQEFAVLSQLYDITALKMLIITNGSGPIQVFCHGREVHRYICTPANAFEVTGAGDVFTGTFLASYFQKKHPIDIAIEQATAAAQVSLSHVGVCNIQIR
jgi:sugar/nucleoside kinase (ribokinase family)